MFTAARGGGSGTPCCVVDRLASCADENLFRSDTSSELICVDVKPVIWVPVSQPCTSVEDRAEICRVESEPIWPDVKACACAVARFPIAVVLKPCTCVVDRF